MHETQRKSERKENIKENWISRSEKETGKSSVEEAYHHLIVVVCCRIVT
jgi:hypothetical protein